MNKYQNSYAEWKKVDQKRVPITGFHLYEIPENANESILTESTSVVPGDGEWPVGGGREGWQRITSQYFKKWWAYLLSFVDSFIYVYIML